MFDPDVEVTVKNAVKAGCGGDIRDIETYKTDTGLSIIKSIDKVPKFGDLMQVSVSGRGLERAPLWNEVLEVARYFFKETECMILPFQCSHTDECCISIWQCPEPWQG